MHLLVIRKDSIITVLDPDIYSATQSSYKINILCILKTGHSFMAALSVNFCNFLLLVVHFLTKP